MPINVPFSPRFLLAKTKILLNLHLEEVQSHTQESIDKVFVEGEVDINRSHWRLGEKGEKIFGGGLAKLKEQSQVAAPGEKPINLSDEEVRVLFAFGMSSVKGWLQGGVFGSFTSPAIQPFFLVSSIFPYSVDPIPTITRGGSDPTILDISSRGEVYKVDSDFTGKLLTIPSRGDGQPQISYHYNFRVNQKKENDQITYYSNMDKENYKFQVDENILNKIMIPYAIQALQSSPSLSQDQLIQFVPYLMDVKFTKIFIEKLSHSPELKNLANYLIAINFSNRSEDLQRIADELDKSNLNYYLKSTASLIEQSAKYQSYLEDKTTIALKKMQSILAAKEKTEQEVNFFDQINTVILGAKNNTEIMNYFEDHPDFLENLKKIDGGQEYDNNLQSIEQSINKLNSLIATKNASFDDMSNTDNKNIIDKFSAAYYKNEKIFKDGSDPNELNILRNVKTTIDMIGNVTIANEKPQYLQEQQSEIFRQIDNLIKHIENSEIVTKSWHSGDLKYQLERRYQLLKDVAHSRKLKDELHNVDEAIETLPEETLERFGGINKVAGLEWVSGNTALDQFQNLCAKVLKLGIKIVTNGCVIFSSQQPKS